MVYISGIQQIGIGVKDVQSAFSWYRKYLGFDVPIFEDAGTAELMLRYTAGQPQDRHAILATNMQGGGGFEIWQYTSRQPQPADFNILAGDLGINVVKVKAQNVADAYLSFKKAGLNILGELVADPAGNGHFFLEDPYGNMFQVTASDQVFQKTSASTGGAFGVIIGVEDMSKSLNFYNNILGYDQVLYDETDYFDDLNALPGGQYQLRRVLLTHSQQRQGPFSKILGQSVIELIKVIDRKPRKIFENRLWGDLGFIHLCYDIQGMESLKNICSEYGYPFTVDSNPEAYLDKSGTFDMGQAAGHFSYTEDPNGTLIEFVETHKVPILKGIGWYIHLKNRKPDKPLPKWMLNTLAWKRVKD